jgi:hypothetical protein
MASLAGAASAGNYVTKGGLKWMPISDLQLSWIDANDFCTTKTINGQKGWRLPTKYELTILYDSKALKDQGWTLGPTWSSTPAGSGLRYYVYLDNGNEYVSSDTRTGYVTCVR